MNRVEIADMFDRLQRIEAGIFVLMRRTKRMEHEIMSAISDVLDQAEANAKAESDAEDAAIALLVTLSKAIADLKAAGTDPATVARIQALADGLKAKADALGAAIVANTPSA